MPFADPEARRAYIKEYSKKYAIRNRARMRQLTQEYVKRKQKWFRELIRAHKKANPCVDCGERNLRKLEFDHIDPKSKTRAVSSMTISSEGVIRAEIAKCVIRCRKCHYFRTRRQAILGEISQGNPWKLSDENAAVMWKLWKTKKHSQRQLAKLFNVSLAIVSSVTTQKRASLRGFPGAYK